MERPYWPLPGDCAGADYFVENNDVTGSADPLPPTYADCRITPLIDGYEYTAALRQALDLVGDGSAAQGGRGQGDRSQFILLAGWWLGLAGGAVRTVQGPVRRKLGITDAVLGDGSPFCLDPRPSAEAVAQVRSKTLCPDPGRPPASSVTVHDWPVEETVLQWIAPHRRITAIDPRCQGRPLRLP